MKLPQRPLTRVIALTTSAVLVAGGAAVADDVSVTLGVVNGLRALQVTGVSAGLPVGNPALAFNGNSTSAPFGLVVSDVAYGRSGYSVSATMSNLYRIGDNGAHDCAASVPSGAFSVSYPTAVGNVPTKALVDSTLTFVDDAFGTKLSALGLTSSLSSLTVSVEGLIKDLTSSLELMTVAHGSTAAFGDATQKTGSDAHPVCGGAVSTVTNTLQDGTTANPSIAGLTTTTFNAAAAADVATVLTPTEAINAVLLPTNATVPGGNLYDTTETAVVNEVNKLVLLGGTALTDAQIDTLVAGVVADLEAVAGGLVLDYIGQTGVYTSIPSLNVATTALDGARTGLYHGVMTVTLADK